MNVKEQIELLKRGAVELVSEEELERKLSSGRPLRVKLGVDPTSPDLHLGHTVVLSKLRFFQDLGHKAVLIIGDFTAKIGDPSGRDQTRPSLTADKIQENAATYRKQAFKVLDPAKTEIRSNSEWLEPFVREQVFSVLQKYTVSQLLQREDFALRTEKGLPITLLEILYPIFQGYDSVAVKADVELGGNDQLFNLLFGRQMQKDFGQESQVILTMPLLRGTDGVKKMSKTYQNAVALEDSPKEMFGKIMSLPDDLMLEFYELLTREDMEKVKKEHPKKAKLHLAEVFTAQYHGEKIAREALEDFEKVFSQKEIPEDVPVYRIDMPDNIATPPEIKKPGILYIKPIYSQGRFRIITGHNTVNIVDLLVAFRLVPSKNEARRLLAQGGVRLNEQVLAPDQITVKITRESMLKVGRRRFLKIIPKDG